MELKDFPMLSEDVLILSTDERIDRFQIGQAIFIQAYQDEWLAVQGDERVKVSCSSADLDLFSRLVLRDQVRWLLTSKQGSNRLLLQYCAPVEVSAMQFEIGVDELIADDLFSKQEIADKNIDLACRWLADQFLVLKKATGLQLLDSVIAPQKVASNCGVRAGVRTLSNCKIVVF